MNAIELLKEQHRAILDALSEMTESGKIDDRGLRHVADQLVAHMVIEEHVFYPRSRELMEDMVKEAFEEHAVARFELARAMMARGEERKPRVTVLKELLEHHIQEEEDELFPAAGDAFSDQELDRLGTRMQLMFDKAVERGFEAFVMPEDQSLRAVREQRGAPRAASARKGPARRQAGASKAGGARAARGTRRGRASR